jgi:hypothetical protein
MSFVKKSLAMKGWTMSAVIIPLPEYACLEGYAALGEFSTMSSSQVYTDEDR